MTTKRKRAGFVMILAILSIVLAGSALVILTQMSSDFLLDAKQAQTKATQRDETISLRSRDHLRPPD